MRTDAGRDAGLSVRIAGAAVLVVAANLAFVALVVWLVSLLDGMLAAMEIAPTGVAGGVVARLGDPANWRSPAVPVLTAAFLLAQYLYVTRRPVRPGIDGDADQELADRLRRLATQAGVPTPDVVVARAPAANSYAVGRRGAATVVVTAPLVAALDDDELDAVLAHELAHVVNRDVTVMTMATTPFRLAGRLSLALDRFAYLAGLACYWLSVVGVVVLTAGMGGLLVYRLLFGGRPGVTPVGAGDASVDALPVLGGAVAAVPHVGAFLLLVSLFATVPLVATGAYRVLLDPVPRLLARYREFAADRGAARITGDPAALVSALQTLDDRRPGTDLRRADPVAALCLRPVGVGTAPERGPVRRAVGRHLPAVDAALDRLAGRLVAHPPTADRVERLRALAA